MPKIITEGESHLGLSTFYVYLHELSRMPLSNTNKYELIMTYGFISTKSGLFEEVQRARFNKMNVIEQEFDPIFDSQVVQCFSKFNYIAGANHLRL